MESGCVAEVGVEKLVRCQNVWLYRICKLERKYVSLKGMLGGDYCDSPRILHNFESDVIRDSGDVLKGLEKNARLVETDTKAMN